MTTTTFTKRLKDAFFRSNNFFSGTSTPRPRLYGSSDIEDRDVARVLADLRFSAPKITRRRPAARGPEE
jgi:hypothetical protein